MRRFYFPVKHSLKGIAFCLWRIVLDVRGSSEGGKLTGLGGCQGHSLGDRAALGLTADRCSSDESTAHCRKGEGNLRVAVGREEPEVWRGGGTEMQ